ncbi:MAG: hypothetical protein ACK4M0_05870 [Phreatobacter sp.]
MTEAKTAPASDLLSVETLPEGDALGLVADALVAALLARVRTMRILLESDAAGIQPDSAEARLHARLTDTERRLRERLSVLDARGEGHRAFLD